MGRTEVLDRIRTLVATLLEVSEDEVAEESRFVEDLDADSLDLLELVVVLKDEFAVNLSDGEVKDLLVELARFLPDTKLSADASDSEFAEVTRKLTIGTITDFVTDRVSVTPAP